MSAEAINRSIKEITHKKQPPTGRLLFLREFLSKCVDDAAFVSYMVLSPRCGHFNILKMEPALAPPP
jgi:hypothetical protein